MVGDTQASYSTQPTQRSHATIDHIKQYLPLQADDAAAIQDFYES